MFLSLCFGIELVVCADRNDFWMFVDLKPINHFTVPHTHSIILSCQRQQAALSTFAFSPYFSLDALKLLFLNAVRDQMRHAGAVLLS